jgi:hypothetical protein
MERSHRNDDTTRTHITQSVDCETRGKTYRAIINAGLQKPESLDVHELRTWYEEYVKADGNTLGPHDPLSRQVEQDELNEAAIEACILELSGHISVKNGFCEDCQYMFDNWPDLSGPKAGRTSGGQNWPGTGAKKRHAIARNLHTLVLEAAARKGCEMCTFMLQTLKAATTMDFGRKISFSVLYDFRRIEARLHYLGATQTASLSVQNLDTEGIQELWVNYPGKIKDDGMNVFGMWTTFQSEALSPSGKYSERVFVND